MIQINDSWKFAKLSGINMQEITDISQLKMQEIQLEEVNAPHTWYEEGNAYEGVVVYKKKQKQTVLPHNRLFLQFEGADRWCRVYINGMLAGEHKGGYSAFAFDITNMWNLDQTNDITVLLDNRSWECVSPLSGDFTVFGGIYRNVNLIVTEQICFDRTYFGTDGVIICTDVDKKNNGVIEIETRLLGCSNENLQIHYICRNSEGAVVVEQFETMAASKMKMKIMVEKPTLWNGMTNPVTYDMKVELIKDGIVIDCVEKKIGFKKVRLDAQTGFYLNGEHLKINGVAKHQDSAEVYNATTEKNWLMDLRDIIDIGANSVRLSHYQHPQKMYDLCDESGLLVWAEIPFLKLNDTEEFYENIGQQLKELILQNIHHPSICFWGVQNEIAMFAETETTYRQVRGLESIVKELDRTRISAGANLFGVEPDSILNHITDAVGYNLYYGWYYGEMKENGDFVDQFHKKNPDVPLGITEYGVDCNLKFHNSQPKVKDYSEEFQTLYHETVYPIFQSREYIWGTYVWNLYDFSSAIRDEGGVKYRNCKGLISFDRKIKKDSYYYYKSQWSGEPFVKIAESRYINRIVGSMDVKVYSNQKEVTLTIPVCFDGSKGQEEQDKVVRMTSDNGVFIFKNVKLRQGENMIQAVSGNCKDCVTFVGREQEDESYVYVDQNPGLNVRNWFTNELEEEKLFPKNYYSIRKSCSELLENEAAMKVIENFNENFANQLRERGGAIPLERVLHYMKGTISEEQCMKLNKALTKIPKK